MIKARLQRWLTYQLQSGGIPTDREIGVVFPASEDEDWALYFEYEETGYVDESEKDDIDADKLLQSYKDGTEQMIKFLIWHRMR